MKKIIVIAALTLSAHAAHAGGPATGGASEWTQIMNNGELVAAVGQQANLNATSLQQYITQAAQLNTMQQNLLRMKPALILKALGPYAGQLAPYVKAYQATTALGQSAAQMSDLLSVDTSTMQFLKMDPSTFYQARARFAAQGAADQQALLANTQQSMQDLQAKSQAVSDIAAHNPEIAGNVDGFQHLATQNTQMSNILLEQSRDLKTLIAMEQTKAAREAAKDGADAVGADAYFKAREAERHGLIQGLSYPKKGQ